MNMVNICTIIRVNEVKMAKVKLPFISGMDPDNKPIIVQKEGEFINVVKQTEPWSEYELEDGTIIRTKQTMLQVVRMDEPDKNGRPVYNMQSQPSIVVIPKG